VLVDIATRAADHGAQAEAALRAVADAAGMLEFASRDDGAAIHRFPFGQAPGELSDAAAAALRPFRDLGNDIDSAYDRTQQAFQGEIHWERGFEAEDWLPVLGQLKTRALAIEALLEDFARPVEPGARARWAYRHEEDIELVSTPIVPGRLLADALWARAYAAVCTSATLTAVGRFQRFLDRSGLVGAETLRIPSPFDFPRIATLSVPRMRSDPGDFSAHSDEVAELLPGLLADEPSALVLFTSWRQMFAVLDRLDPEFRGRLKVQGEAAKQALLDAHRHDVDAHRPSVLFGLASFAEGVDLPDDYCRHVVIVKLPFAVPDDPLDQAMAEWAEHLGRNPFYDISVPDAAQKLVQACGRLIRHENDWGTITLLDRRIVTRRYGQDLLRSLPPYRLEVA
jgi:ATP-dependent DNA helicase DinG